MLHAGKQFEGVPCGHGSASPPVNVAVLTPPALHTVYRSKQQVCVVQAYQNVGSSDCGPSRGTVLTKSLTQQEPFETRQLSTQLPLSYGGNAVQTDSSNALVTAA